MDEPQEIPDQYVPFGRAPDEPNAAQQLRAAWLELLAAQREAAEMSREVLRQNASLLDALREAIRYIAAGVACQGPSPSGPEAQPLPQSFGEETKAEVVDVVL